MPWAPKPSHVDDCPRFQSRFRVNNPDPDPNLEAWAWAELKKLPPVPAPATLLPRVLQRLEARARRYWWLRVWWDWPLAAKVASLMLGIALAGSLGGGGLLVDERVAAYAGDITERFTPLAGLWDIATALGRAAVQVWAAVAQPVILTGLALGTVLYLLCLGLGTAVVRSIWKRI